MIDDGNFKNDETELIEILSKGYDILHPEIIQHLITTGVRYYTKQNNKVSPESTTK